MTINTTNPSRRSFIVGSAAIATGIAIGFDLDSWLQQMLLRALA